MKFWNVFSTHEQNVSFSVSLDLPGNLDIYSFPLYETDIKPSEIIQSTCLPLGLNSYMSACYSFSVQRTRKGRVLVNISCGFVWPPQFHCGFPECRELPELRALVGFSASSEFWLFCDLLTMKPSVRVSLLVTLSEFLNTRHYLCISLKFFVKLNNLIIFSRKKF